MKKYLIFITVLLSACSDNTTTETSKMNSDTLMINNKIYTLDSITKEQFVAAKLVHDTLPPNEIIDDTAHVKRDSLKLTFHLSNGKDTTFVSDTADDDGFIIHQYIHNYTDIDYWLIFTTYYESGEYALVDKNDGTIIPVWSYPILSPDAKHVMTNSFDMEMEYAENGFQLFTVNNRKLQKVFDRVINNWGPSEIRWKDNTTVLIQQELQKDSASTPIYVTKYKELKLVQ